MRVASVATIVLLLALSGETRAQERRLELGAHLATTFQHELDTTDVGFGARAGFLLSPIFTLEGELNLYPSDVPAEVPVSSSRLEGLFGIKAGPRFDGFSVFGKVRPGFVRFGAAPEPFACILIFPPPLSCVLAEGRTLFALDLGGGVEFHPTERSFLRVDVSALLLDYPGPAFHRGGEVFDDSGFWGSSPRLTFGAGYRF